MNDQAVDDSHARGSWEEPDHVRKYVGAVTTLGLWQSERLLIDRYVPQGGAILDYSAAAPDGRPSACTRPATAASPAATCPPP